MLGTMSSKSNSYRNVTSIVVNITPDLTILIDCGNQTFMQLTTNYGNQEDEILKKRLQKIKVIFITHYHVDHNLGLNYFLN